MYHKEIEMSIHQMVLKLEKCTKISTFLLSQCSKLYMKELKTINQVSRRTFVLASTDWLEMISD